MTLVQINPPDALPVSLEELKAHLRILSDDEGALILSYAAAAVQALDGARGWLGRALVTQTWELRLEGFRWPAIALPLPPCQEVVSIVYTDTDGAQQTLNQGAYQVAGIGGSQPAQIVPAYGTRWPSTRDQPEAVKVTFTAGYGAASDVPEPIRAAIMLMVTDLFEHRGSILAGSGFDKLQPTKASESLLMPHRVW